MHQQTQTPLVLAESMMRTADSSALDETPVCALESAPPGKTMRTGHFDAIKGVAGAEPGTEERDLAPACGGHKGRGDGDALLPQRLGQTRTRRISLGLVLAENVMHTANSSALDEATVSALKRSRADAEIGQALSAISSRHRGAAGQWELSCCGVVPYGAHFPRRSLSALP
ncbi:hypothetical protein DFH06DRAFT_1330265 [Mycena polygramma]|nr:hypothetical protein DFH06DRAFT_1330265 [Mycena polygramma]